MDTLSVEIKDIRHIEFANFEISLEPGVYAFVGNNGCGKSTVLQCLAQLTSPFHLGKLKKFDTTENSYVKFTYEGKDDEWTKNSNGFWIASSYPDQLSLNGMYEGSLFYGTRFDDSKAIDNLFNEGKISDNLIVDSDDYIKDQLSFILHGNRDNYRNLRRVRSRKVANSLGLASAPYFSEVNGRMISQYRMSSGECLLISLLHFVYNSIIRKSLPKDKKIMVLIDEIELALHPVATGRLIDLFTKLANDSDNLIFMLTSHSPEVIRKITPANLYCIKNQNSILTLESNSYPGYVLRDIYVHDGFDFLILVEDDLARLVVDKVINHENLRRNKSIHIVPAGGWRNVLTLHHELLSSNALGLKRQIASILDGDIQDSVDKNYNHLKKAFLPLKSVEKFIYDKVFLNEDYGVIKILNDKYFTIKSIEQMKSEHNEKYSKNAENQDKKFYFRLKKDLKNRGIDEKVFITNLCDDLFEVIDFSAFKMTLHSLLT